MGRLTTHVLDTVLGRPAAGLRIRLARLQSDGAAELLATVETNRDGRVDAPVIADDAFTAGTYELTFEAGGYFKREGIVAHNPPFLDEIPVRFTISDATAHYHVPLLLSPWSYSTYRGS